jgi:hypothetical protein
MQGKWPLALYCVHLFFCLVNTRPASMFILQMSLPMQMMFIQYLPLSCDNFHMFYAWSTMNIGLDFFEAQKVQFFFYPTTQVGLSYQEFTYFTLWIGLLAYIFFTSRNGFKAQVLLLHGMDSKPMTLLGMDLSHGMDSSPGFANS